MSDTVVHGGLEWQTKSIDLALGGTMDDYEVKGARLWLTPFHLEDSDEDVSRPSAKAGIAAMVEFLSSRRRVSDPPVDTGFHGVLDLYRTTSGGAHGPWTYQYQRLVFVCGRLVSESSITEEAERADGRGLAGDWVPDDLMQRMAWQLQALQGLVAGIAADPTMQRPESALSLAAMREADAAVLKAIKFWGGEG